MTKGDHPRAAGPGLESRPPAGGSVDPGLLQLIACPETRQPLRPAPADLLARLNARQARGELVNRAGQRLAAPLAEGLVREDGRVLYPVLDGIPMLLVEEAIAVDS